MYDDIRIHVTRSYTSSADCLFSLISSVTLSNHLLLGLPLFYFSVTQHSTRSALGCPLCTPMSRYNGAMTQPCFETGVKQGCVIAPDLFNCVIDHLMCRLLSRCSLGIQLGEYQLTDLDYADDIVIIDPSACVVQEALMILQEEANLVGMQISWPKTKLMATMPNPTNHLPLKLCNTEVRCNRADIAVRVSSYSDIEP